MRPVFERDYRERSAAAAETALKAERKNIEFLFKKRADKKYQPPSCVRAGREGCCPLKTADQTSLSAITSSCRKRVVDGLRLHLINKGAMNGPRSKTPLLVESQIWKGRMPENPVQVFEPLLRIALEADEASAATPPAPPIAAAVTAPSSTNRPMEV